MTYRLATHRTASTSSAVSAAAERLTRQHGAWRGVLVDDGQTICRFPSWPAAARVIGVTPTPRPHFETVLLISR